MEAAVDREGLRRLPESILLAWLFPRSFRPRRDRRESDSVPYPVHGCRSHLANLTRELPAPTFIRMPLPDGRSRKPCRGSRARIRIAPGLWVLSCGFGRSARADEGVGGRIAPVDLRFRVSEFLRRTVAQLRRSSDRHQGGERLAGEGGVHERRGLTDVSRIRCRKLRKSGHFSRVARAVLGHRLDEREAHHRHDGGNRCPGSYEGSTHPDICMLQVGSQAGKGFPGLFRSSVVRFRTIGRLRHGTIVYLPRQKTRAGCRKGRPSNVNRLFGFKQPQTRWLQLRACSMRRL